MRNDYKYSLLKTILNLKVSGRPVWKKRIQNQTQFIHLLEDVFGTEITKQSFGFYPGRIYFATPLTSDPNYTQKMGPTWIKIKRALEHLGWDVYAPFAKTDPHSKIPDNLDSYQIRDLDHIQVLTAEAALFDLNRPSHGVGQEIEMSVFMPTVGFSQERVSRMTKGMPGMIVINYQNEKKLLEVLKEIFSRKNFKKEPFFLSKCPQHTAQSVFKGKVCLNCAVARHLHIP